MEAFKNMKRSSRKRITIINTYDLPKPCSRVQMIARTPTKTKTKLRLILLLIIGNWNPKIIKIKKMRPTKFQIKILVLVKTSSSNKRHGSCTMLLIILQKQHRFNLNQGGFNKWFQGSGLIELLVAFLWICVEETMLLGSRELIWLHHLIMGLLMMSTSSCIMLFQTREEVQMEYSKAGPTFLHCFCLFLTIEEDY